MTWDTAATTDGVTPMRGALSLSKEQLYLSYIMGDLIFSTWLNEFMDYFGDDNIEGLLSQYKNTLTKKHIRTHQELMKVIRIDFEKMIFALMEVKNKKGLHIISDFFGKDKNNVLAILPELSEKNLYHLGFEVNQPMDLILYSFKYWIDKFNHQFKDSINEIKISRQLRFPASQAFQNRVNAYVEILRIWLELDHRELMLELFDIHHPLAISMMNDGYDSESDGHPHVTCIKDYPTAISRLLAGDSIWHYAIYVNHPNEVEKLHTYFKALVTQDMTYELPFVSLVNNKHDGSLYTKIINKKKRIELEFVTEIDSHVIETMS
ncbi:MAG: hypothetical protein HQK77_08445 [Desulfobacterales bacterium]|nr:hypothetical protein [Desulfobacterales bacterium]